MLNEIQRTFLESLQRAALAAARIVPEILVALAVLVVFALLAVAVRVGLRRALARIDLDRRAARWGLAEVEWVPEGGFARLVARVGFWTVAITGALVGLQALEPASALAARLLGYVPQVLLALALVAAGAVAARFVERSVLIGAVNLRLRAARLLSAGVKWLVLVFALALALQHVGIGGVLVTVCFAILFGGIVLALALAVGLGSRDAVRRAWEEQAGTAAPPPGSPAPVEVRHF